MRNRYEKITGIEISDAGESKESKAILEGPTSFDFCKVIEVRDIDDNDVPIYECKLACVESSKDCRLYYKAKDKTYISPTGAARTCQAASATGDLSPQCPSVKFAIEVRTKTGLTAKSLKELTDM